MGVTGQNNIAFLAIILQLVFTIAVWIRKSIPAKEKEVSLYLITFGLMILIPTMILGTIVFPEHEANLFPLIIVLMGQIYTIRPRQIYIMNLLVSVLFLILSYRLKTYGVFMQDLVSILSTNSITIVCCTVCMHSRLEIDNKEHDLKQMCSIDRMTGLLNKTTFESKYNEYRNSRV